MKEPTSLLRIRLADVSPTVWRRVEVPLDTTLAELHLIIQAVMAWWDYHLYEFQIGDETYSRPSSEQEIDIRDDNAVSLQALIDRNIKQFNYIYDFGDWWEHEVSIGPERIGEANIDYPVFLGGKNNCPPEDVGGPHGYIEYLAAISDPSHVDHEQMIAWRGQGFDPNYVNERLIHAQLNIVAKLRKLR